LGVDYRWAPDDAVLVWKLAKELVELRPDVIVARSTPVVATLLGETRNIPIVFVSVSDPIGEGFVATLAHPNGNVTGFTNFESSMTGKCVGLLKQIAPEVSRVAFLFNPQAAAGGGSYFLRAVDAAVSTLKVQANMALVHDDEEIEAAFTALGNEPGVGAVLLPDIFTVAHYQLVVALASHYHIPTIYPYRFMVERGGLISYGVDIDNLFERAATYVDRILRGASPADLPVQAPTKFELVINQKTAKALDLTVPYTLLVGAEEVIE
jgi:putative tryptophan/tyrosine transport system substrate-binding protein